VPTGVNVRSLSRRQLCRRRGYSEENPVRPHLKRIKERRDPIVPTRAKDVAKGIALAAGLFAKR
jgi:hypothetical protein